MEIQYIVFLILKVIYVAESSKILMLFPSPAPSHLMLGNSLAKGLADAGHEVTMVSAFEKKISSTKGTYRNIVLTGMLEAEIAGNLPKWREFGELNNLEAELQLAIRSTHLNNFILNHPKFQKLIHSNERFDVVILEQFLYEGLKILGCHFKAPLISFSTFPSNFFSNPMVGNPAPPSYVPDVLLYYSSDMNLWQRTMNSLLTVYKYIVRDYKMFPEQIKLLEEHFPECSRDIHKILYNASLTFLSGHESITQPVPLVPSMIPIGGIHISPPEKLPDDLQKFMDEAEHGVVYFSLGTLVEPSSTGKKIKQAILKSLGSLKQKVLWKWDEDVLEGQPENVVIKKFFPQQAILAHPNTKLFVTHGGLLSTTETVYHGVPTLVLPVFGDQLVNAAELQNIGCGIAIPFQKITEENLTEALWKLLNNPQYLENTKKRSSFLRDRPIKPLDLAIYWVEFVIRHQGAPHLRVAALDLEWYQYLLLDVIAVVILSVLGSMVTIIYIFKILLRRLRKTKPKQKTN